MERYGSIESVLRAEIVEHQQANDALQRALDAEREKVKELVANQAEYEKCTDEQITALNQGCLDYEKQIATLQAQLADRDAMILQMGEQAAVLAKENMAVKAQLRQVEEALQERKEFIADCDTALDRIQAPRTNEGQEELVSTWRRIELLGKLLYQYRQELERSAPTLRAENARLRRGLENCHMLARRIVASESAFFKIDSANHIIRMCEEAGVTSMKGVLKDAALREHIKQLESNAVNLVDRNKALRIECVEAQQERDALRLKVQELEAWYEANEALQPKRGWRNESS